MSRENTVLGPILFMKAALLLVMLICIFFAVFVLGPMAETKWFGVVGKLRIVNPAVHESGGTILTAEFEKYRDCEYLGITWSRVRPNGSLERVPVSLQRQPGDISSLNRPLGITVTGPWVVGMPLDQISEFSFVEVFHKCHPAWITRTQIYP